MVGYGGVVRCGCLVKATKVIGEHNEKKFVNYL